MNNHTVVPLGFKDAEHTVECLPNSLSIVYREPGRCAKYVFNKLKIKFKYTDDSTAYHYDCKLLITQEKFGYCIHMSDRVSNRERKSAYIDYLDNMIFVFPGETPTLTLTAKECFECLIQLLNAKYTYTCLPFDDIVMIMCSDLLTTPKAEQTW
jgi:hypothetical protein